MEPYLKCQQLFHYVDGSGTPPSRFLPDSTTINPAYLTWTQTDQLILNALISSLSDNLIAQVVGKSTARDVWFALETLFASKSHAQIIQLRYQLATISKGSTPVSEYFHKVKHMSNTMSATGTPLSSPKFVSYLLAGLNSDYDALVPSVTARTEPLSSEEIYSLLLTHESRLSHSTHLPTPTNFSANFTSSSSYRGRGFHRGNNRGGFHGRGRGRTNSSPHPSSYNPSPHSSLPHSKPTCQLCGKVGHVVMRCYHRFDQAYQSDPPKALTAHYTTSDSSLDQSWYPDTAATNHLTSDLANLNIHSSPYDGNEQIRVGDGNALPISNIGDSVFSSSSRSFILKNLLHVPNITKNLVLVR